MASRVGNYNGSKEGWEISSERKRQSVEEEKKEEREREISENLRSCGKLVKGT